MNSPECPCHPHTEVLQEKRDAFLRQFEDSKALMKNVADKYPDGTTSADLRDLELLGTGKPPFRAGSLSDDLDFDGMVKEARYRLIGRSTRDGRPLDNVNHPVFGDALTQAEVWEASFVKFLFEYYRNGLCLNCIGERCDLETWFEKSILAAIAGLRMDVGAVITFHGIKNKFRVGLEFIGVAPHEFEVVKARNRGTKLGRHRARQAIEGRRLVVEIDEHHVSKLLDAHLA